MSNPKLDKFKEFLARTEPSLNINAEYVGFAFEFAKKQSLIVSRFLGEFLEEYCYHLALHLICLTPSKDNPLFVKYFPESANDERLKNYTTYASSVSDSTSSVTSFAFAGLANMSIGDSMLILTPYGAQVKVFNDSLNFALVVV